MKASKFSDAQKAFILKQGVDGVPLANICHRAEISQATYINWKKYVGMLPLAKLAARRFCWELLLSVGSARRLKFA